MPKPRELRFNAFNMTAPSHNWAGLWSHPRDTSINYNSLDYWVDYARTAERGLLDGIFLADVFGVYDVFGDSPDTAIRHAVQLPNAEPTLLVSAMALATTPGSGSYPRGVATAISIPTFGAPNISECAMLLPSPTHAIFRPFSFPKCSQAVK